MCATIGPVAGFKTLWHEHPGVRADNTAPTAAIKTNTDLLDEIHLHVANIGLKIGAELGNFPPSSDPST